MSLFWGHQEPNELIEEQLKTIKCKECKHESSNYFVYNHGFFCTSCFSKLKHVQSVQLFEFADIIKKSTDKYTNDKKLPTSPYHLISEEMQKKYNALKVARDEFTRKLAIQKKDTIKKMQFLNECCVLQNTNQPLQQLYQPNLRVSSNMSITDILQRNLANLKLRQEQSDTIYEFIQKDTKATNQVINTKFDFIKSKLEDLRKQSQAVIEDYQKEMKQLKK